MAEPVENCTIKIVLFGTQNTGKSCLVRRFTKGEFDSDWPGHPTIGSTFGTRTIGIEGRKVKLALWDTGGTETWTGTSKFDLNNADGVVIVYDVADFDANSFRRAPGWVEAVNEHRDDTHILLVGAKCDAESHKRTVSHVSSILCFSFCFFFLFFFLFLFLFFFVVVSFFDVFGHAYGVPSFERSGCRRHPLQSINLFYNWLHRQTTVWLHVVG